MSLELDSIEKAIAEIAAGRPVVVVDDDDRENEGDLVMAASLATPEWVGFIIRHTGGVLCVPLTVADARRLQLQPMVAHNDAPLATAFTVSVDYRVGLTTGISAEERSNTVRALANGNVGAADFVRPGHIFPLIAREGGVLIRTGHTEASVDLARLAGLAPVALISELVNDDGSVQKGEQIQAFARAHKLALVSIADLIAYRQRSERLVSRLSMSEVRTAAGTAQAVVYETPFDTAQHLALVYGDIGDGEAVLTRLQRESTVEDVFNARGGALEASLKQIAREGRGVVVYLRQGAVGVAEAGKLWGREGHQSERSRQEQWREVGLGAQILRDLGIRSIRVLGTRERTYIGLSGFDVEVLGTEIIHPE
ncbi:MAG: 3,4-dihydroxy-2-butanone-4-phosphate synthase [Rhizobiales bacterium]|nr:3,4-dihydroxy-2-butanone-4-phosphate synthase [Hyphomicrobiales bacterium]